MKMDSDIQCVCDVRSDVELVCNVTTLVDARVRPQKEVETIYQRVCSNLSGVNGFILNLLP